MTTQTWLANTTGKTEASAGTAVTLRAAQSGSSKKLTVNSGLISFLQNSSALTMSGYSLTGSQATSLLDMTGVWNTSGTPTALKLNVTDTNSNASSALLDLQVGGVSQFKVSKAGAVTAVGVAVPTISSTDTLSNKTLSSPTVSGTIAGAATWSGAQALNGGITQTSTYPYITMIDTDSTSGSRSAVVQINADQWLLSKNSDSGVYISDLLKINLINSVANFVVAPTAGGVAIPTISSTDTLSNKTLSSPTLSGTVAGTPSYSSAQNFPFNSTLGDVKGLNGEARIIDDAGFISFYNGAETVRSGYLQITSSGTAILANEVSNANFNITTAGTGVLQANGTKVPTISSTDTLSNKTLSGVTIADATNIILNTTTGTKIGTGTSQKLGFFNATPVVQPTAVADATDAASVITQLNALLSRMRDLGLIAT